MPASRQVVPYGAPGLLKHRQYPHGNAPYNASRSFLESPYMYQSTAWLSEASVPYAVPYSVSFLPKQHPSFKIYSHPASLSCFPAIIPLPPQFRRLLPAVPLPEKPLFEQGIPFTVNFSRLSGKVQRKNSPEPVNPIPVPGCFL